MVSSMYDSVMIVAHGSGPKGSNDAMERHAGSLSRMTGVPVRCAYRRYSMQRVRTVMESFADDGFRSVAVIPAFLSDNMYASSIERAMGRSAADGVFRHGDSELEYRIAGVLGEHPSAPAAIADAVASEPGCGAVLVAKHKDGRLLGLEERAMELLSSKGVPVARCDDPDDPEAGRRAMESIGCEKTVFVPVSFGRSIPYELEGAVMLPPFGRWPAIPGIMKNVLDGLEDGIGYRTPASSRTRP